MTSFVQKPKNSIISQARWQERLKRVLLCLQWPWLEHLDYPGMKPRYSKHVSWLCGSGMSWDCNLGDAWIDLVLVGWHIDRWYTVHKFCCHIEDEWNSCSEITTLRQHQQISILQPSFINQQSVNLGLNKSSSPRWSKRLLPATRQENPKTWTFVICHPAKSWPGCSCSRFE